ncbi:unnamed protein product, partial [Effrenium voratum]
MGDESVNATLLAQLNAALGRLGQRPPPAAQRLALEVANERFVLSRDGSALVRQPEGQESDCTVVFRSASDCWALAHGRLSPSQAYAQNRLALRGSISALMALRPFVAEVRAKLPVAELFPGAVTWLPDSAASSCMACDATFTLIRRRHHCRSCGRLFCERCCPYRSGCEARQCEGCRGKAAPKEDWSEQLRVLQARLEEVEALAAQKEAEELLAAAQARLLVCGALAAMVLALSAWQKAAGAFLLLGVVARGLFFRQLRALWLCVLILWHYQRSSAEAQELCEADAQKLLSARYRRLGIGTIGSARPLA